jgi:hypothetical protein
MSRTSPYSRLGEEAHERVRAVAGTDWRGLSNQVAVVCERASGFEVAGKQPSHNQYLGEATR